MKRRSAVIDGLEIAVGLASGIALLLMPKRWRDIVLNEADPAPEIQRARDALNKALCKEALRWPMSPDEVESYMRKNKWDIAKARQNMAENLRIGRTGYVH